MDNLWLFRVLNQATQPSFYPVSCEDLTKPRSKSCTKAGMIASSHVPKWNVVSSGTSRKDVKEKDRLLLFQYQIRTHAQFQFRKSSSKLLQQNLWKCVSSHLLGTAINDPRRIPIGFQENERSICLNDAQSVQVMVESRPSPHADPRLANEIQAQNFKHPRLAFPLVQQKCASMISAAQYRYIYISTLK